MFIKRLTKIYYDVFMGTGWNNWTRVRRNHWGMTYIAGAHLPRETIKQLNERLVLKKGN